MSGERWIQVYLLMKYVDEQEHYVGKIDGKLEWTSDRKLGLEFNRREDVELLATFYPEETWLSAEGWWIDENGQSMCGHQH